MSRARLIAAAALVAAAGAAHAGLFDDDEARKRIEELRAEQVRATREVTDRLQRLEEGVKNLGVVDLLRQIEQLNAEIARIRGQLEVLANQNEQVAKRQRDFYLDLDSRLKRLEGGPGRTWPGPSTRRTVRTRPHRPAAGTKRPGRPPGA